MNQVTKDLRQKWSEAKAKATSDELEAINQYIKDNALTISPLSYYIVQCQMQSLDLEGIPYRDAKTFKAWKQAGYMVKKGQHHFGTGITWNIGTDDKDKEGNEKTRNVIYPVAYHLFHRTQVEKI